MPRSGLMNWIAATLGLCFTVPGCAKDAQTSVAPECPEPRIDAGDYWNTGMCSNGGTPMPCCPVELPPCEADAGLPACIRASGSNALCVCCESTWTCVSDGAAQ